jgi:hypothetical protein
MECWHGESVWKLKADHLPPQVEHVRAASVMTPKEGSAATINQPTILALTTMPIVSPFNRAILGIGSLVCNAKKGWRYFSNLELNNYKKHISIKATSQSLNCQHLAYIHILKVGSSKFLSLSSKPQRKNRSATWFLSLKKVGHTWYILGFYSYNSLLQFVGLLWLAYMLALW